MYFRLSFIYLFNFYFIKYTIPDFARLYQSGANYCIHINIFYSIYDSSLHKPIDTSTLFKASCS